MCPLSVDNDVSQSHIVPTREKHTSPSPPKLHDISKTTMSIMYAAEEKKQDDPMRQDKEETFADTFFSALLGAQMMQTAYLGLKIGWYQALSEAGEEGLNPTELADKTNTSK